MKTKLIIFGVVIALAGLSAFAYEYGISVGNVDIGGSEKRWLAERTYDFLEDLQFKDFARASTYHLKTTQEQRDIPELIKRVFVMKHENLDIIRFEIQDVDFDRSGSRARIRTKIWYRFLSDGRVTKSKDSQRDLELMFYWFRSEAKGELSWTMELASSL